LCGARCYESSNAALVLDLYLYRERCAYTGRRFVASVQRYVHPLCYGVLSILHAAHSGEQFVNIPVTFKLANRRWHVRFKRMRKAHGKCSFDKARITLDPRLLDTPAVLRHTFIHELLHATSWAMGWDAVNRDEDRIDALAGMLAQAFDTMEGTL
jgi:hypothetical protein